MQVRSSLSWEPPSLLAFFQCGHLYGCHGALNAFIAVFSTRSVNGLLQGVVCQHAKNGGYIVLEVDVFDPLRDAFAYKGEMLSFPADHRSYGYDGIEFIFLDHVFASVYQLKASRHIATEDVLLQGTVLQKRVHGTFVEVAGDLFVPFRNNDPKPKVLRVWDRSLIVSR